MDRLKRGEVWWAALGEPQGSGPGDRHPVVIVSSDTFNSSRISTIILVVITSNLRLATAPGNMRVSARETGLRQESVINVSQVLTMDKRALVSRVGHLSSRRLAELEVGLRGVLAL